MATRKPADAPLKFNLHVPRRRDRHPFARVALHMSDSTWPGSADTGAQLVVPRLSDEFDWDEYWAQHG